MRINSVNENRKISFNSNFANTDVVSSGTEDDIKIQPVKANEDTSREFQHGNAEKEINEKQIKKAVDKLNKFLQGESTKVEYERHDKFKNDFTIKIIDKESKKVIKEVPPKKILDMIAQMCEMAGVIFDKKA